MRHSAIFFKWKNITRAGNAISEAVKKKNQQFYTKASFKLVPKM